MGAVESSGESNWRQGPTGRALGNLEDGVIEVWRVWLEEAGQEWANAVKVLSGGERERAAGIVDGGAGALWARGRAALRMLLGGYLGMDPEMLAFETGRWGKPRLAGIGEESAGGGEERGPRFNLSHSGDLALMAFSASREVGVDLEREGGHRCMERGRAMGLARRVLGQETARRLEGVPRELRERELLRAWTAHEAAVKCAGVGLGGPIGEMDTTAMWTAKLDLGRGAFGALAVEGPGEAKLRCWDWRPA